MKIKQVTPKKRLYRILFSDDLSELIVPILGHSRDYYSQAFVYFFRRFGATTSSSDPDKELVRYTIQTPKKGWLMNVGFTSYGSISYTLYTDNKDIADACHKEMWQISAKYWEERDIWLAANGMTYYETIVDIKINPEEYNKLNEAYQSWQKENGYGTPEKPFEEGTQKLFMRHIYTENKRVTALCPIEMRDESEFQFPIRDEAIEVLKSTLKDFLVPTSIRDTAHNILGKITTGKIRKFHDYSKNAGIPCKIDAK